MGLNVPQCVLAVSNCLPDACVRSHLNLDGFTEITTGSGVVAILSKDSFHVPVTVGIESRKAIESALLNILYSASQYTPNVKDADQLRKMGPMNADL